MKFISVSGLIGTEDYLVPYHRITTKALEVTPSWRRNNDNGHTIIDVPVAGMIPVSVTRDGVPEEFKYKSFSVATPLTKEDKQILTASDFSLFTEGVYYTNTANGELFYVLSKDIRTYEVAFRRGIMGTPVGVIPETAVILQMNTLRLDSGSGSETLGSFSLNAGLSVMEEGDYFTIVIDRESKTYVVNKEIPVCETLDVQAQKIADVLAQDFVEWSFTVSGNNITATQREGYGHAFAVSFACVCSVADNSLTYSLDTAGVSKSYDSGFGFIIYKEMPRNLVNGQKVYPSYNYNVNGR